MKYGLKIPIKEQAVFQLYKKYNLETVNDEVWIAAKSDLETTETKGRKSVKKRKTEKANLENLKVEEVEAEVLPQKKDRSKNIKEEVEEPVLSEVRIKEEIVEPTISGEKPQSFTGRITRQSAKK